MSSLKSINANIKNLAAHSGKVRALALSTVTMLIEHGAATGHYDRVPAFLDAISWHSSLTKECHEILAGSIPHPISQQNGSWKIGKKIKDFSPISAEDREKAATEKAAARKAATEKAAASRKEKEEKAQVYDRLTAEVARLQAENQKLREEVRAYEERLTLLTLDKPTKAKTKVA